MEKIKGKIWYIINHIFLKPFYGHLGMHSFVYKPLQVDNIKNVYIGDNVYIAKFAWLCCGKNNDAKLQIKSNTTIGHYSHIVAYNSVTIENKVLVADKVFISDCTHNYWDINKAIIEQDVSIINPVVIGEGSWLGENVCVCGANIGKHCVIAANSVVTRDIPDYCVAAGCPANVVKKYNFDLEKWEKLK